MKLVVFGIPLATVAIHFSDQLQEMASAFINNINILGSLPEIDLVSSFGMLAASPFALILAVSWLTLRK